jgi:uncharacterized protein with HEPN domain
MAPAKNPLIRLYHIRDEIDGVSSVIEGLDFQTFSSSYVAVRTIERALQIVSEAAKSLPDELISAHPGSDWTRIRSLGNLLRHEYHHVDNNQLWLIATEKLAELRPVVLQMIAKLERPGDR